MKDSPEVVERVESEMKLARDLAERYLSRHGDYDALESEAMLALLTAARSFDPTAFPAQSFHRFARRGIVLALQLFVRQIRFAYLTNVPRKLKRAAVKCFEAVKCLQARGILRPTPEQIAGEARISVEMAVQVAAIRACLPLQSVTEWCDSKVIDSRDGEPDLVPLFGPQLGWSPFRECFEIHDGPIEFGSVLCCMQCHISGMDRHPALRRSPRTDPKPEPKPPVPRPKAELVGARETRRQKRSRLWPKAEAVA